MSFNSFYTGLTGLRSHAEALNVIGHNLANLNTVGYKASRAHFSEIFAQAGVGGVNGAGNSLAIGTGSKIAAVQQRHTQGALQPTDMVTDLSLQGAGFFVLKTENGAAAYSRAGNFSFNSEGFLVDPNGHRVQAYTEKDVNGRVISSGNLNDVYIPMGLTAEPQPTDYFRLDMNLDALSIPDDVSAGAPVGVNEAETAGSIFTTGVTVFDALGASHQVTIKFTPEDTDGDGDIEQWSLEATVPGADISGGTAGTPMPLTLSQTTLTFDGQGNMTSPTADIEITMPGDWTNTAPAQTITWRLFDESGTPVIKSYADTSALDNFSQDGYGTGRIQAISVDNAGLISGVFTNGRTLELAQFAVANFNNPGGLLKDGDNIFVESIGSGPAAVGQANTGGRGEITARALELSNVDITEEFTSLIIAERGYQSNSRVITTTDSVMQEALQIKR